VTLRQFPAAVVLGLVAALVAHAALFGGEHAMGGAYNAPLLEFGAAAAAALAAALGTMLWSASRYAADGSVLARRAAGSFPGFGSLAIAATAWFAFGECVEPAHAGVPLVATAAALLAACWAVLRFARAVVAVVARVVFRLAFAPPHPEPVEGRLHLLVELRQAQRDRLWARRFTRPPPVQANA
jgi:hypothetical protein